MEERECCLVVVGAGASFDCLPEDFNPADARVTADGLTEEFYGDVRPPLTASLAHANHFTNTILKRWPDATLVVDYLDKKTRGVTDPYKKTVSLEEALAAYEASRIPEAQRHLYGFALYLRDLLWAATSYMESRDLTGGRTNYHTLVRELLDWSSEGDRCVVIVSFNYDLLLEGALNGAWGFSHRDLKSYLQHDRVSLLKPHGSVQWAWRVQDDQRFTTKDQVRFGAQAIAQAVERGLDQTEIQIIPWGFHEWDDFGGGPLTIPAMALPVQEKDQFVWPREQEERLKELQGCVSRLVVIGWRAIEDHFLPLLTPLVRQDAQFTVVTGGPEEVAEQEAHAIAARLSNHVSARFSHICTTGFRGFVNSSVLRSALMGAKPA